jgi:hypothetical protein
MQEAVKIGQSMTARLSCHRASNQVANDAMRLRCERAPGNASNSKPLPKSEFQEEDL